MNPLLVSTQDKHGAGTSAYRLHAGLQRIGVPSKLLVRDQGMDDAAIDAPATELGKGLSRIRQSVDALPLRWIKPKNPSFSLEWVPDRLVADVKRLSPDLVNLHWICKGYVQIESIAKLGKPVVWTLHDMWAFTGGCHYHEGCDRYQESCGACPQLSNPGVRDASRWVWNRKRRAWTSLNLTVVAPSRWLAECAQSSSLFGNYRVETIPYGLDTEVYKPIERHLARRLLNLPNDKRLVLFGATVLSDRRKGWHLLQSALEKLSQSGMREQLECVVFGSYRSEREARGIKTHFLGRLNDDVTLALAYSAADVFIAPSIQDNLPNTVMEALACGTPCVAFKIGGMPDMIDHCQNGYLVAPFDVDDLVQGVLWVLGDRERHAQLGSYAREQVEQRFSLERQAYQYQSLFAQVLDQVGVEAEMVGG